MNRFHTLLLRFMRLERKAPSHEIGTMITDASQLADELERKRIAAMSARKIATEQIEIATALEIEIAAGEKHLDVVERAASAALNAAEVAAALTIPRWQFTLLDAMGITDSEQQQN